MKKRTYLITATAIFTFFVWRIIGLGIHLLQKNELTTQAIATFVIVAIFAACGLFLGYKLYKLNKNESV